MPLLDTLPFKMEKHFTVNSRIVIYPQQFTESHVMDQYDDITAEPLTKGIETIQKIGKGIGNIFKTDSNE